MDSDGMSGGVVPGLISGYVFLAYAGPHLHDIASGVFSADSLVGFVLHSVVSIVIGAIYVSTFLRRVEFGSSLLNILIGGSIYGLFWWIAGSNIIVPLITGGQILQLSLGPSFYGHIIFGHMLSFMVIRGMESDWEYVGADSYANRSRREHPAGYVYGIFNSKTQLTKIGRTIDPKQRLRQLRQEHGKHLEYKSLRKTENAPKEEKRLHKKFKSKRKDGEWFDME